MAAVYEIREEVVVIVALQVTLTVSLMQTILEQWFNLAQYYMQWQPGSVKNRKQFWFQRQWGL